VGSGMCIRDRYYPPWCYRSRLEKTGD